jgi:hypothetical protein
LKLAKYAVENENKELKRQVESAAAPIPFNGPTPRTCVLEAITGRVCKVLTAVNLPQSLRGQ